MRALAIAAALLMAQPALAGPDDPWTVDPRTSRLAFNVARVGTLVDGRFERWSGDIVLDPANLAAARIDIRIDMRSTKTNSKEVDELLLGKDFLDIGQFPEARFASSTVVAKGGDRYEARGKLTIRDATRDLVLPFRLTIVDDATRAGNIAATVRGRLELKRLDYGIGRNEWANVSHVADEVTVDLSVAASRPR